MYIGKQQRQKLGVLPGTWKQLYIIIESSSCKGLQETFLSAPHSADEEREAQMLSDLLKVSEVICSREGMSKQAPDLFPSSVLTECGRENKSPLEQKCFLLRLEENESLGFFSSCYFSPSSMQGTGKQPNSGAGRFYPGCLPSVLQAWRLQVLPVQYLCSRSPQPHSARTCALWVVRSPFSSVGGILLCIEKSWQRRVFCQGNLQGEQALVVYTHTNRHRDS